MGETVSSSDETAKSMSEYVEQISNLQVQFEVDRSDLNEMMVSRLSDEEVRKQFEKTLETRKKFYDTGDEYAAQFLTKADKKEVMD